ncbi:Aspirochlorine biosynthesis protein N [Colletotrichum shisoi]|uniref:Aspirochlorine biosynthesis protein N n=1 Tax=Colletotrichum shisoi TaxID=2078593 RepID=A0A5Q4BL74_9PEZI|nr:Aspirochlorine biosynthesis protein N [Colletotrichum shisoi]
MACGTVEAEVDYLQRLPLYQREKPFQLFVPIHERDQDGRSTNLAFEKKTQTFVDMRGRTGEFSLDTHGFQVETVANKLAPHFFRDQEAVEREYLPELRDASAPREVDDGELDMNDLTSWLRPSPTVHTKAQKGSSTGSCFTSQKKRPFCCKEGVWRPIENPVQDYPLACCDSTSVLDEDLVECDHVRRRFKGSNLYTHHREGHKWFYLGEQRPDEVLLIKMFDSDSSDAHMSRSATHWHRRTRSRGGVSSA